jgi:hypothetical protein
MMTVTERPEDDLNPDPNVTTIRPPEIDDELSPPSSSRTRATNPEGHSTESSPSESPSAADRFERIRSLLKASTSEVSPGVASATASMTENLLLTAGIGLNNRREKRTHQESSKWLLAPTEARDLSTAIGNIVGRRASVMEGVAGPDAEDLATIAMTGVSYASRQLFNVSPAEYERQLIEAMRASGVDPHGGPVDRN